MPILRMSDIDLGGKRVLIRQDLNVPIEDGRITSQQRITASIPTIRLALEKGAAVASRRRVSDTWARNSGTPCSRSPADADGQGRSSSFSRVRAIIAAW